MTALTQDLSIDSKIAHVDEALIAGEAYTIGDEVIRASHALIQEWDDVSGASKGLRWFIERGEDHTTAAAHSSGATLSLARKYGEGGDPGEQTVYVQATDPGAVGAGKLWVDTSEGTPPRILIRNVDDEWVDLLKGYIAAGPVSILATDGNALFGRSDDGVVTAQLELASGQSTLVAQDEAGIETGGLRISNLIGVEDLTFSFSGDGLPEVPASPTEQDIVDALLALGLVTQAAP